jgi:hypothetical protein
MAALKQDGLGHRAIRKGEELLLGSAEIRVFGEAGLIYAAPDLIYHYVLVHHYSPPEVFVRAMKEGPKATDSDYFKQLNMLKLDWSVSST